MKILPGQVYQLLEKYKKVDPTFSDFLLILNEPEPARWKVLDDQSEVFEVGISFLRAYRLFDI